MTGLYLYDAAYAPSLSKVKKRPGAIAMNGYLTGRYAGTTSQPAAVRKAGLGYVATYEEGPGELVRASRATGRRVGDKIVKAFRDKGIPIRPDIGVFPSVDVSVPIDGNDHDADQCNTGWEGVRDVLDGDLSLRAYAEGAVIDALATAGLIDGKCWLAAPTSWPGFNVNSNHICMVQLVGTDVPGTDKNHLVTDPHALGAWWPEGSPYAQEDPLSNLTDEQLEQIAHAVWAHTGKLWNKSSPTAWGVLSSVHQTAHAASDRAATISTVVNGMVTRVASLQAAVAAFEPAKQMAVDATAVANAAKVAVVAELKKLVWGVK